MRKLHVLIFIITLFLVVGCGSKKEESTITTKENSPGETDMNKGKPIAVIETNMGTIEFEMYPDVAPKTVESFIKLTNKGFYDSLIFHRVIKGFMIQGGDPDGNGTGGPGYTLPAEFSNLHHEAGTVSMARKGNDINSAGSQFFICLAPQPFLDGKYTIFGKVIKGFDIVEKIGDVPTTGKTRPPFDKPLKDVVMKKVTIRYEN